MADAECGYCKTEILPGANTCRSCGAWYGYYLGAYYNREQIVKRLIWSPTITFGVFVFSILMLYGGPTLKFIGAIMAFVSALWLGYVALWSFAAVIKLMAGPRWHAKSSSTTVIYR